MTVRCKSMLTLASAAGIVTLLLGACGGGAATPTPRPTTAPTATARPQATPTATTAPAATATATARPQATATVPAQATATPVPTVRPTVAPTATAASVPAFPQAKYGGALLERITEGPIGWDSHQNNTGDTHNALQPMFDQLVQMDPYNQSQVIGQIARSWKASGDGLNWTFELARGVKFHDGSALTSQDVKYTYETVVMNPPKGIPSFSKGLLSPVGTITTPDDYTVTIKLNSADASFLSSLGFGRMAIFSKAVVEATGREKMNATFPPIGTGPFKGKTFVRGVSTEIVKNESYYVPGRPFLDSKKFFVIPDGGTALAAFLSGQINFGQPSGYAPKDAKEIQGRLGAKVTIQQTPSTVWRHIEINALVKPFDDVRVRQAIGYAVDKMGLAKVMDENAALGAYLVPGTGWELPEAELKKFPGFDTDLKANVAKAKELLTQAGYPTGFKASYFVRNHPQYIGVTTYVQSVLNEIGIKGEQQLTESAKYFEVKVRGSTQWQMAAGGLRTNGIDPNAGYRDYQLPDAPRSTSGLNDPKLIELFNAQNTELDPAKRKQKVWDMERYWLAQQAIVPLYYQITSYMWYSNVKNFQYHVSQTSNMQFRDVWLE